MKILFIHGLASSGAYKMASSLRILLKGSEVIAPDVPIEPAEALTMLKEICSEEKPDLIVGLSLGGFWAQKLRGFRKFLVNPDLHPSKLLRSKIGVMEYLSPRQDGATSFEITEDICRGYEALEQNEFEGLVTDEIALTTGFFADHDEMVDCFEEFISHYPGRGHRYPGTHLPNYPQIKEYFLPVILNEISSE
ncbi:MAG: hypothetical protein J5907_06275 [Bacteroidales bacterium]|nr:hypothetical protein [Bacteroidales bacterium]